MTWRPISTHPKDDGEYLLAAYVRPSAEAARNGSKALWCYGVGSYMWDRDGVPLFTGILGSRPSHWQPIVEPQEIPE